jgi:hypothetical protein
MACASRLARTLSWLSLAWMGVEGGGSDVAGAALLPPCWLPGRYPCVAWRVQAWAAAWTASQGLPSGGV